MKNVFGNNITITLFGESHGDFVGAVLDGVSPGVRVDREYINAMLAQRRPKGKISTARVECDEYTIASGVYEGYTTGTPIAILIPNENKRSSDYSELVKTPRPSHADYTAAVKYHGYADPRGGGHFSGRVTAPLVAAGAILLSALKDKGICIGTHISELHGTKDRGFENIPEDIRSLSSLEFPVLDEGCAKKMRGEIERAAELGDSVSGVLETAVYGMPAGVGEPWFDTLEGMLAHALLSVPGIKGIEFGLGFGFANLYGSEANDPFETDGERIYTKTNHSGGINGGISNGMPIIFRSAVKPTPSIFREQRTVNRETMENTVISIVGRHDPAIIHRARIVIDAVTALVLADALVGRYGTDYLTSSK